MFECKTTPGTGKRGPLALPTSFCIEGGAETSGRAFRANITIIIDHNKIVQRIGGGGMSQISPRFGRATHDKKPLSGTYLAKPLVK